MEKYLKKVNTASLKFLEPLNPTTTYETIVTEAIRLVDGKYGTLLLAEKGTMKEEYTTLPIKINRSKNGYTYQAFKTQKAYVRYEDDLQNAYPALIEIGIKSIVFIPLSYKKESIGVLIINATHNQQFTPKELSIFQLFGSMATLAIRKTQLYADSQKAIDTRDLFISMAAHELRTPLTAVNGYIQLLEGRLSKQETTEKKWATQLLYESKRLTLLVNELLEVDQIKTGNLNYMWKECSLKIIIERAINNVSFSHPHRKIIFHNVLKKESDTVIGDFDKILQVITNLLDNAAKFSPMDKDIIIILSNTKPSLSIKIQDFGEGIPQEKLAHVFDGYPTDTNPKVQGMGLGLYLVKNIVKIHQGEVNISSQLQKGTTVEILLPKATL